MEPTLRFMVQVYRQKKIDWLGFKIDRDNALTYHHVNKRNDEGKRDFDNGAPLTPIGHQYVHLIENYDEFLYLELKRTFEEIIARKRPLHEEDYKQIAYILKEFERKYKNKKNGNKNIIQKKYYNRVDFLENQIIIIDEKKGDNNQKIKNLIDELKNENEFSFQKIKKL